MSKIFLSVVVPCFDEMANLHKGVLDKIKYFLDKKNFSYEVIIVDDGSTDGSVQFVKDFSKENKQFKLIENPHFGKAGAVTTGMLQAAGKFVLFTDMDQATPIEELDNLLPYFDSGANADIVIGSRNAKREGAPWIRAIMGPGMMFLRTVIVGLADIKDTQCGFKIFRHDVAHTVFTKASKLHSGFHAVGGSSVTAGFDVELLYIAREMRYKIKEVPVSWLYVETRRVSPVRDSIEGFVELLKIRRNALTGKYKE